jgi:hypothetical protein
MIWKMVDWGWIWVLAVCCCIVGSLKAYDRSVAESMTAGMEYQPFLILLESDVSPQDRMALRGYLTFIEGVRQVKWLTSEDLLTRVFRERLPQEDVELIKDNLPKAVELLVPTQRLLDGSFDPKIFSSFSQIDSDSWDESTGNAVYEEKTHWRLRGQQMMLGLLISASIAVLAAFMLSTERNRLRVFLEQAGLAPETRARAGMAEYYKAGPVTWLRAMAIQALAAGVLCVMLFLTFNQLLALLDSAPAYTLASMADYDFSWACAGIAFLGKGLDLLRIRMRLGRRRGGR